MLLNVFRPNLVDYINLSKGLGNYRRRCKCTSGESRVGLVCGETSVLLCKTFLVYYLILLTKYLSSACVALRIKNLHKNK